MRGSIKKLIGTLVSLTLLAFGGAAFAEPAFLIAGDLEFACGASYMPDYWQDGAVYHRRGAVAVTNSFSESAYLAGHTVWHWNMFVDTARDKYTVKWGTFKIDVEAYDATWVGYFYAEGEWERLAPYPMLTYHVTGWGTGDFQGMKISGDGYTVDVRDHPENTCGEAEGIAFKYMVMFEE